MDQLAQITVTGVLPGSQSMRNPSPINGDAVGILLHDAHHSPPASSSARSWWTTAARWSMAVVVGVEVPAHEVECAVPHVSR
jgi:hypothetical protein